MSIRVEPDGADGYRLLTADQGVVGWVRGRAIGVGGFESEAATVLAAVRSYRILASWLERQRLPALSAIGDGAPHMAHDGAHRWIVIGRVLVARMRVVDASHADAPSTHAFEVVLRGALSEGMAIHAALVVVRAAHGMIGPADIAWAPRWNADQHAAPTPVTHLELEA